MPISGDLSCGSLYGSRRCLWQLTHRARNCQPNLNVPTVLVLDSRIVKPHGFPHEFDCVRPPTACPAYQGVRHIGQALPHGRNGLGPLRFKELRTPRDGTPDSPAVATNCPIFLFMWPFVLSGQMQDYSSFCVAQLDKLNDLLIPGAQYLSWHLLPMITRRQYVDAGHCTLATQDS